MPDISFYIKIMGEKQEREVEIPSTYRSSQLYNVTSDVLTLPVDSFKILQNGRPIKNDVTSLVDAGVKDEAKLTVMITEKVDLTTLNEFEQFAYNSTTSPDPKRKQLAVLRLRKVFEKYVNRLSLDDIERVIDAQGKEVDEEARIPGVKLPESVIDQLVDKSVLNI